MMRSFLDVTQIITKVVSASLKFNLISFEQPKNILFNLIVPQTIKGWLTRPQFFKI